MSSFTTKCSSEDSSKIDLIDLIRQLLWHQGKVNKERWFTMAEVGHTIFAFGDWTHNDVRKVIGRLIEMGEVEKTTKVRFRWKGEE